jgi:beta-glucosidase
LEGAVKLRFYGITFLLLWMTSPSLFADAAASSLSSSDADAKIKTLLSQMTLEEKIGQMTQYHQSEKLEDKTKPELRGGKIGSILNLFGAKNTNKAQQIAVKESRLHIPLLFGLDVIHGYKTIFPIPLAEDCTWNPDLVEKCSAAAAYEASAAGVRWTFAPMVDVCRDPRWGRIAEGSGEDPFLGSQMAAARVKGFQGKNLSDPGSIAACAKHFAGYGAAEAGRDYNTTDMSEVTLQNVYLPPFKAAVDSGVETLMSAFNDLNGIPASGNKHTIRDILKNDWKFEGFVVSDWDSLEQMVDHGYALDKKDAALKGVEAGVDMDMVCNVYKDYIPELIKEKRLPLSMVDDAVKRILKVKYDLGLFGNPYTDEGKEKTSMLTPQALALSLEDARQSIVLLKNEKSLLPLSKNRKAIAVIGLLADSKRDALGSWDCKGEEALDKVSTVLSGIKNKVSAQTQVLYDPGVEINKDCPQSMIENAVATAKKADVAIVVAGETQDMSGEASSRTSLSLPGRQEEMVKAIQATGVPVVLVLMNGRPLTIPWEAENVPAIVESWFLGTQHGAAVADVLFGDFNPSGKLVASFPRNVGQIPVYYAHMNTGRPIDEKLHFTSKYMDSPNTPQYPFGFGLSFTSFAYANLKLDKKSLSGNEANDALRVTADIKNTGKRTGDEIVQLYIRQLTASLTQPVRKLVDFKRVTLEPGETRKIEFILKSSQLAFDDQNGKQRLEDGLFHLWVSRDSADEALKDHFQFRAGTNQ